MNEALRFLGQIMDDHSDTDLDGPNGVGDQTAECTFVWHDIVIRLNATAVPAE